MEYRQLDGNIGELKFYGDISEWWISGEDFTSTLQKMAGIFKAIHIRAHCYGGDVFEGSVMYNAIIRFKKEVKIKLFIDGVSASMMSIVMQACDEIEIAENGFVMVHCPTGYCAGNAKQMLETSKLLSAMEKNFGKVYALRTGKSEKEVSKWFDGADYWFSSDEALSEGLVTAITTSVVQNIQVLDKPTESGQVETVYNRFAALLVKPSNSQKTNPKNTMKKELIEQFNLTGVTENSTDAEIQAAIKAKFDEKDSNAQTQLESSVEAIIAGVERITGKPYEAAHRTSLVAVGKTMGVATLQTMLGATPVASAQDQNSQHQVIPQVITMIGNQQIGVSADRKNWGWEDWQKNDPKALAAMEKTDFTTYNALYKAEFGSDLRVI